MKKDAIIFIPGLGQGFVDQSFENIARRIALAFERQAKTPQSKFDVKITNESFGSGGQPQKNYQVATILREDNNEEDRNNPRAVPLIDVYGFDYHSLLTKDYNSPNLLVNAFRLFLSIFINIPKLIPLFGGEQRKAKTFTEKLQTLYAISILALLIVYMGILLLASLNVLWIASPQEEIKTLLESAKLSNLSSWIKSSTLMVIVIAIIEVFKPNIKESFTKASIEYAGTVDYLALGANRNIIIGKLTDLFEKIAEKPDYENIHVIAYSFGTIIAIDSIFPIERMPTERFHTLKTLVTIGCPFDLIRLLWLNYFLRRQGFANIPKRWLNIYSPVDILSSNFRNDSKDDESEKTINAVNLHHDQRVKPENIIYSEGFDVNDLSLINWLTLIGIRSHAMYWEKTFQSEISCFDILIPKLYENSDFLR